MGVGGLLILITRPELQIQDLGEVDGCCIAHGEAPGGGGTGLTPATQTGQPGAQGLGIAPSARWQPVPAIWASVLSQLITGAFTKWGREGSDEAHMRELRELSFQRTREITI